jgi:hypothetical protein
MYAGALIKGTQICRIQWNRGRVPETLRKKQELTGKKIPGHWGRVF